MRCERLRAGCLATAALAAAVIRPADVGAQLTWRNHIDPGPINEIVLRDGRLYMATFGGLVVYDPARESFEQYDNTNGLPSNALTCLEFASDEIIYVGTEDIGVAKVRLRNGRLALLRALNEQIDGLASNRINTIALWGEDIVYGSTPGAGTIRNDFASARYFARDGLPADDVLDVLPQGDVVVMATAGGLVVLDRLGLLRRPAGDPSGVRALATDGARLWAGTSDGVWRLDPADSSWTFTGLSTRPMDSLFWDGTTMWGGATRNVFRYSGTGTSWSLVQAESVLVRYGFTGGGGAHRMKGLAVFAGGDAYFGGIVPGDRRGPGLMRFDGARIDNLFPNAPSANDVIRLSQDIDGSVWASFRHYYVGKLTPSGGWVNYNRARPGIELPTNQSSNTTMLADSDGIKWICTLSEPTSPKPLDELDDRQDANYANDVWQRHTIGSGGGEGLGSLRLTDAAQDPAGNRWFLSDAQEAPSGWWGIHILSRDRTEWFQMTPSKDSRMLGGGVIDVAFGPGFAFVAIAGVGVQEWTHNGYDWQNLTDLSGDLWTTPVPIPKTGIPVSAVPTGLALRSSDRTLWIATADGLYRYIDNGTTRIPVYTGTSPGILSDLVRDVALDHDENLWVATDVGLNRIARDDENDIATFTTVAGFVALSGRRYPLEVIAPLAHADCQRLLVDRTRDVLYIGTLGGLSVLDFSQPASGAEDLSGVYVYPNPVYGRRGHDTLKIGNLAGPVTVEIYNLEGERVHAQTVSASGDVIWDLTDRGGFLVGSGNYIVRIIGPAGSVTRPVSVLR